METGGLSVGDLCVCVPVYATAGFLSPSRAAPPRESLLHLCVCVPSCFFSSLVRRGCA